MKKFLLSALLLSASGVASANLVVNGSFEDTNQPNGTWGIYQTLPGWTTISGSGIELRNNVAGAASDGVNYVEMDSNSNSGMQQSIATAAGKVYELLFDYSPRVGQPASTNGISVFWNGSLLANITANGGSTNLWSTQHFFVTGTGGNDALKFLATGTSDSLGGNVDNVQLSAVPLPAAAWLFGSAILGFASFSTRRKL